MRTRMRAAFGQAAAFLGRARRAPWVDVLVAVAAGALVLAFLGLAREWAHAPRPKADIDLSPLALPRYAALSLARGLAAYVLSLAFALPCGWAAARSRAAERVLVPLLDVLQSIPVLGFMPAFVLALASAFPRSNAGLELAAVLMIFTGQVWNLAFSFYRSVRDVPRELDEAATFYRFSRGERLWHLELPVSAIGLVWNSMMSMAGGWFFLMISEAFVLGGRDYRLEGLGAYMSEAVARGDAAAMALGVGAMAAMIVLLDQVVWRPAAAWAQRFRLEEGGEVEPASSWFLDVLRRSRLLRAAHSALRPAPRRARPSRPPLPARAAPARGGPGRALALGALAALAILLAARGLDVGRLLRRGARAEWGGVLAGAGLTTARVLLAIALGTLWTVPAGLAIGLWPRLGRALQPLVQVAASFPAPMLFPAAVAAFHWAGLSLGWGSVLLMVLGTQWYVLFNVVAGASAIPAELREAARVHRLGPIDRLRSLYLPATFPYLVTGWVTAAGGAWNASIVAEYVTVRGRTLLTEGLGARISAAAAAGDLATLGAALAVMSTLVLLLNRLVWHRLHHLAETRFAFAR